MKSWHAESHVGTRRSKVQRSPGIFLPAVLRGPVIRCLYVLAVAMIASPLAGLLLQVWPPEPSSIQWRFAVGGLLPGALLMPAVGLLGIFWAAHTTGSRPPMLLVTMLSFATAMLILPTMGLFAVYAIELRELVDEGGRQAFDTSSLRALLDFVLMLVVYSTFAFEGFTAYTRLVPPHMTNGRPRLRAVAPEPTRGHRRSGGTPHAVPRIATVLRAE